MNYVWLSWVLLWYVLTEWHVSYSEHENEYMNCFNLVNSTCKISDLIGRKNKYLKRIINSYIKMMRGILYVICMYLHALHIYEYSVSINNEYYRKIVKCIRRQSILCISICNFFLFFINKYWIMELMCMNKLMDVRWLHLYNKNQF